MDKLASSHSRVTKDICRIFAADPTDQAIISNEQPKCILIEGAPGIGKTVLAKEIVFQWSKGELLKKCKLVFLVYLRDPRVHEVRTISDLLSLFTVEESPQELEKFITQSRGENVAFVFDGFDEYPAHLQRDSLITSIIKGIRDGKLLHRSVVVITSRPTASLFLHGVVDRRIEILGFAKEERDKYISLSLKDSPNERQELEKYLKLHPVINGLCFIPLHLAILLFLFHMDSSPETLTEMNEFFIVHTLYRYLRKTAPFDQRVVTKLSDLPEDIYVFVLKLAKLAYKGLKRNQLVFSYDKIKKMCPEIDDTPGTINGFGLLQAVQHYVQRGAGKTTSFNFLHFTMQEYLAALHVSNLPIEGQLLAMKLSFWEGQYNFMWMMYVGIVGTKSNVLVHFLSTYPKHVKIALSPDISNEALQTSKGANNQLYSLSRDIQSDKRKCLHLFQCYMEAKSDQIPVEISSIFSSGDIKLSGVTLLPPNISSLSFFMSASNQQWRILDLGDCNLRSIGMNAVLDNVIKNEKNMSTLEYVDLSGNHSSPWSVYCAIVRHCCVNSLTLCGDDGMENYIEEITSNLNANKGIVSLSLNSIGKIGVQSIGKVLVGNKTLNMINLSWKKVKNKYILLNRKMACPVLPMNNRIVDINILCDDHKCSPDTIELSNKDISDDAIAVLAFGSSDNTKVYKFGVSLAAVCDPIKETVVERSNTVKIFNVSHNKITSIGMKLLTEVVKNNMLTLEYVDLSGNHSSPWSVYCAIIRHCRVNSLTLCGDDGMEKHVEEITGSLNANKGLESLTLYSIGKIGLESIKRVLVDNETLNTINFSWKQIKNKYILFQTKIRAGLGPVLPIKDRIVDINILYDEYQCPPDTIKLSDKGISDNEIALLAFGLSNNTNVYKLGISHTAVCDPQKETVVERSNTVKIFDVSHNKITSFGMKLLTEVVKNNMLNLEYVDLSGNHSSPWSVYCAIIRHCRVNGLTLCGDHGMEQYVTEITHSLEANRGLDTLTLHSIGRTGIDTIKNVLVKNTTIREVSLSQKKYRNEGKDNQRNILLHTKCPTNTFNKTAELAANDNSSMVDIKILDDDYYYGPIPEIELSKNIATTGNSMILFVALGLYHNTMVWKLDLSYNDISDDGAVVISDCLKRNNTLMVIDLSNNKITGSGMKHLLYSVINVTSLNYIDLSGNTSSPWSVYCAIIRHCRVNGLTLCGDHGMEQYVTEITHSLEANRGLDTLTLHSIGRTGIDTIKNVMVKNTTIREVSLSQKKYRNEGKDNQRNILLHTKCPTNTFNKTAELAANDNSSMVDIKILDDDYYYESIPKEIELSKNIATTRSMLPFVALGLYHNTMVWKLDLSYNNISDDDAVVICDCLTRNNTLMVIDLSNNKITGSGMKHLLYSVNNVRSLNYIDLSGNASSPWSVYCAIIRHCRVYSLTLCGDRGMEKYVKEITECLEANWKLVSLSLCRIRRTDLCIIQDILVSNSTLGEVNLLWTKISNEEINNNKNIFAYSTTPPVAVHCKAIMSNSDRLKDINIIYDEHAYKTFSKFISCDALSLMVFGLCNYFTAMKNDISCYNISDKEVEGMCDYLESKSKYLYLYHSLSQKTIDYITALSREDTLCDLSGKTIGDAGAVLLSTMLYKNINIIKLNISWNNITDVGAIAISCSLQNNNTLEELYLFRNSIGDIGAIAIAKAIQANCSLKKLNFSLNKISASGAVAIIDNVNCSLCELMLSHNTITDAGILYIAKSIEVNTTLRILDISQNCVSKSGILSLCDSIKSNTSLLTLTVSLPENKDVIKINGEGPTCNMANKNMGDSGAQIVSALLYSNTNVVKLDVSGNQVMDDGTIAITNCLMNNTILLEINISHNKISVEGAYKIAEVIQSNMTLRKFDVSYCGIPDDGAVVISESYKHNTTLQELIISWKNDEVTVNTTDQFWDLSNKNIGNTGVLIASNLLHYNTCVKQLNISYNNISEDGVLAIICCLTNNNTLEELYMLGNDISQNAIYTVFHAVNLSSSLKRLQIDKFNYSSV